MILRLLPDLQKAGSLQKRKRTHRPAFRSDEVPINFFFQSNHLGYLFRPGAATRN